MATVDFFRARLDAMIDLKHPLAVLPTQLPWAAIKVAVAPKLAHEVLPAKRLRGKDLLGAYDAKFGGGVSPADRPRLLIRLMASLLHLKNSFNLSQRRGTRPVLGREPAVAVLQWHGLLRAASAMRRHRDQALAAPAGRGRHRATVQGRASNAPCKSKRCCRLIGSAGIVDLIVRSKVIAHPVDSGLLEIARCKVVSAAKHAGTRFKQTVAREGKTLRRKTGGDFHAKQFKLLRNTVKRLRTILGVMVREVQRKLDADKAAVAAGGALVVADGGAHDLAAPHTAQSQPLHQALDRAPHHLHALDRPQERT